MAMNRSSSILYFDHEGRDNLLRVIKVLRRTFRNRPELRSGKVIFFTAFGEGPALAYNQLQDFDAKIIAVTFPPSFTVRLKDREVHPHLDPKVLAFFHGVGIKVLSGRLPLDPIKGADALNRETKLIKDVFTTISGSFPLCIQAVLQSCDMGEVSPGEVVIAVTGDCAAIVTASTTESFLSAEDGLVVNEILCKPRVLNIARRSRPTESQSGSLFQQEDQQDHGPRLLKQPNRTLGEGKKQTEQ